MALPNTELSDAPGCDPRIINTPLIAHRWEETLRQCGLLEKYKDVPLSIKNGFYMGVKMKLSKSYTPENHASALSNPAVIEAHIQKEVSEGRYSGPFSASKLESLIGYFRTSPLGIVPKPGSDEFRIVQDLSYPRDDPQQPSVNSEINSDDFPCTWGTFETMAAAILSLDADAQGATMDVDAAFRRCPLRRDQQNHFVIQWKGLFWLDHNVPFGAASSGGVFGRLADAMADILLAYGFGPSTHWVDDYGFLKGDEDPTPVPPPVSNSLISNELTQTPRSRFRHDYTISDIEKIAAHLGWPWKKSKTKDFSHILLYIGFEWNIRLRFVQVPQEKRKKFLKKLEIWVPGRKVSKKEAESLQGTLVHASLVVPSGRAHLHFLIKFTSSFGHTKSPRFAKRSPSSDLLADVAWWREVLINGPFGSTIKKPPPPRADYRVFVDASTSFGVGVILNGAWERWRLKNGWNTEGRDIGWAEFVALEMGVRWIISTGLSDANVTIQSDNKGVIGAMASGRSRNSQQNSVLRRIEALAREKMLTFTHVYIPSEENPADSTLR